MSFGFENAIEMGRLFWLSMITWHVKNFDSATGSPFEFSVINCTESIEGFGLKSFKAIYGNETGNLVYSPIGAARTLYLVGMMTYEETWNEIERVIDVPLERTTDELDSFVWETQSTENYKVHSASALFYDKRLGLSEFFVDINRETTNTSSGEVDFSCPEQTSETVNEWCAKRTAQRIRRFSNREDIDPSTKILAINAVHYKANIAIPPGEKQKEGPFYVEGVKSAALVKTVHTTGTFCERLSQEHGASIIKIAQVATDPVSDEAVTMYIVIPDAANGLGRLMKKIDTIDMNRTARRCDTREFDLCLPAFKIESTIHLRKPLETLGIKKIFTPEADFLPIVDKPEMIVNDVIQKIIVEVNGSEDGAFADIDKAPRTPSACRLVNRPFVALMMKNDGTFLFAAVIQDPRIESSTWYPIEKGNHSPDVTCFSTCLSPEVRTNIPETRFPASGHVKTPRLG